MLQDYKSLLNITKIINYWFWYHNIIGFDNITDVHYKWSFILLNTYTIGFFISTFRLSGLEKWIYNASGFNYHQQLCYCNAVNSILKVSKFQNDFMKSSFLPKYEQKILMISALCSEGRKHDKFSFIFWEKQ